MTDPISDSSPDAMAPDAMAPEAIASMNSPSPSSLAMVALRQGLRVVLVEPAGGLNVGAIARVMKNMGLEQLVIVSPKCEVLGDDAQQMAVHAKDVLKAATVVNSIPAALAGCQRVVATTARDRYLSLPFGPPRDGLTWALAPHFRRVTAAATHPEPPPSPSAPSLLSALIFGPEDRGLSNAELVYAQRVITIPAHPDYTSLNLAQAVAVCCYEAYQLALRYGANSEAGDPVAQASAAQAPVAQAPAAQAPAAQTSRDKSAPERGDEGNTAAPTPEAIAPVENLAPADALEGYYQHLEQILLRIGYLYPHTAQRRMEKFRVLFNRSQLTQQEVSMLRGILRQMNWALAQAAGASPGQASDQDGPSASVSSAPISTTPTHIELDD